MKRFLLLFLLAFQASYALAASPIIYFGTNSKDLTSQGLITQALSLPNGVYKAKIQAPTLGASETFTLPTTTGATGQVLQTDGTGVLSWQSPASNVFNTQALTAVTAVGTAGFPQLGHILDTKDFTAETSAQFTFYNLAANGNDGSTQAINLTANGTPTYTTTNILGTTSSAATLNGTTQYYSSTNAFFNPGNGKSFAMGGWFQASNWMTTGATLIGNFASASDRGFLIFMKGNGIAGCAATNSATSWDSETDSPVTNWSANSWHNLTCVYDFANTKLSLYLDGKLANSVTLANVRTVTSSRFQIGADSTTPADFLTGAAEDAFFISGYTVTADDIRKLAARRFDHNSGISPDAQVWSGTWGRSDQVPYTNLEGWIVSKEKNSLWADFSGVATGAFVGFKGQSLSYSSTSVSQFSYDSTWLSTTPATTIAHGMGAIPDNCKVQYTTAYGASGAAQTYDCGNYCSADSTNFYCDWTGLTVNSTNTVRLTAWMNGVQTAVTAASAGNGGIVNTSAQTFAGAKTFSSAVTMASTLSVTGRATTGNSKARGHLASNGTCAGTSTCVVPLDTKNGSYDFDTNGELDVTTNKGRFTAVASGYYAVTCKAVINSAVSADGDTINVYKNGTQRLGGSICPLFSTNAYCLGSDVVFLNGTTDYVDCRIFNGNASSKPIDANGGSDPASSFITVTQVP